MAFAPGPIASGLIDGRGEEEQEGEDHQPEKKIERDHFGWSFALSEVESEDDHVDELDAGEWHDQPTDAVEE
jgi:hypothetical protein